MEKQPLNIFQIKDLNRASFSAKIKTITFVMVFLLYLFLSSIMAYYEQNPRNYIWKCYNRNNP